MLVEEEKNTATVLQDYLHTIGYQVKWIDNRNDFLNQVQNIQPDLVFFDFQLIKDIRILNLLNILRQEPYWENLPIVMMTSSEYLKEEITTVSVNANEYLVKPIRIVQLESVLMRYLS